MVTERRRSSCRLPRHAAWVLVVLMAAGSTATPAPAHAAGPPFRLSDAAQHGTFNVGDAQATAGRKTDPAAGDVLTLDYALPRGTAAGLWSKGYPEGFGAGKIDVVRLGVRPSDPDQGRQVAVSLEIKGTAGAQKVPVALQDGWNQAEATVNWPAIGTVNEVVVSVERIGDAPTATGSIALDVRFDRLPPLRKLGLRPGARIAGVVLLGLLGALLAALLRGTAGHAREGEAGQVAGRAPAAGAGPDLRRDFVQGAGVAFIAALAIAVYLLGGRESLEVGWTALGVAVAGAAVAEWWKYGLTGKHLTPSEVFLDLLATGLFAASASRLTILQAPASWSETLLLSQTVAAVGVLVYHGLMASRLAGTGRRPGAGAAALIVGTPYALGGLVLLESDRLMQELGGMLTAGLLAGRPEWLAALGRVGVVFGFNLAAAHGLGMATRGVPLRSLRAHLMMLGVAAAVIAAPWIAAFGSGATVAAWSFGPRLIATLLTTMLSQAPLWAEVYLITGMVLDAIHGKAPTRDSVIEHPVHGAKKGAVYSGTFMAILYVLGALGHVSTVRGLAVRHPLVLALIFGALAFPLAKTVIETFDGSQVFFRRVLKSYRNPILYLRGAVVGLGLGYGAIHALDSAEMLGRVVFGLGVGVVAFAGIDLLGDAVAGLRGRGRVQSWRVYLVHALLGGFIGAAVGFYLDSHQVALVSSKFERYLSAGTSPHPFDVYPLLSKWGHIELGHVTGGVSLLFAEALTGVISWSVAAWLFAINRTFMTAYFRKETTPIREFFTPQGMTQLGQNTIEVLRWGLWMSPIISSFLRPMGEPTWYNQDGAIRTLWAIVQDMRLGPDAFRAWSLQVFIALLAYDAVRVLIWLDHMGLRVATLVNLSFLGMDRLDSRLARFLSPAATARCIPEGVKRFTTWAPLLIPYYIPMGQDWDYAWSHSEALQRDNQGGYLAAIDALSLPEKLLLLAVAVVASTALFAAARWLRNRFGTHPLPSWTLRNPGYEVELKENGEVISRVPDRGYDVSRRSYDLIDPAGRALFLVDGAGLDGLPPRSWPLIGNVPAELDELPRIEPGDDSLKVEKTRDELRATVAISLPGRGDPAELWTITVENLSNTTRQVRVVPYLEWVLNRPDADRGHTQYNRLFAEMEYVRGLHAVLAWDRHAKATGFLASDVAPEGFLTSRIDFNGRARSLWSPRVLETFAFTKPQDTEAHPTFDPIASLLLGMTLAPRQTAQIRLLIGLVPDKARAIDLIARHLEIPGAAATSSARVRKTLHSIGHGEIPPGTPQPYCEFSEDGRTLQVHTPFTPRPFDHTMSNARGHVVSVTNRGLHTSASVNAQQNRITPDWSDTVTREVPGEAFYLYDPDRKEWYSPTYHPLNDPDAGHDVEFSVDGTATFRTTRGAIEIELTVFVPPDDPTGVYLLTVRNQGAETRRLRVAPYFQMVLAAQPEHAGPLAIRHDGSLNALFYENPRNDFRTGPAFAALSCPPDLVETRRGRFFGEGRSVAHPALVEHATPDLTSSRDDRPIAAFLATLEVPARGEHSVVVILGQADDRATAEAVIRKYRDPGAAWVSLDATRRWWLGLMKTLTVRTSRPEFDRYLYWLRFQALAGRIWARRGFYQASGAFGFRDQLQDAVNLIWMDPLLARRQILLHAAQQFLEGDVVHWFHRLQDGRTGFAARTYASDNLLWLAWAVVEYVGATGDHSILDERTTYLEAEQPLEPLPAGKHGMGFDPLRSSREDTVYRHCLRAIDLVLDHRMGAHRLPLIGTGDWNDGLDEIGSQGKGESVWLGFFLYYILDRMIGIVGQKDGPARQEYYTRRLRDLKDALEWSWRDDRYLRAIHDDGTEIGVKGSGVWEIDALTAAWAVMTGINPERGRIVFETAVRILEQESTLMLGWPPLREDTHPYLGRSSGYPEGVRENGMYCHGDQWLAGAARILADQCERAGQPDEARRYRATAERIWWKISSIPHAVPGEIETYGGQPNQQAADMVTTFDPGRMIWNGYTGSAGWMFRQAIEAVLGLRLVDGEVVPPADLSPPDDWASARVVRDLSASPLPGPAVLRPPAQRIDIEEPTHPK